MRTELSLSLVGEVFVVCVSEEEAFLRQVCLLVMVWVVCINRLEPLP